MIFEIAQEPPNNGNSFWCRDERWSSRLEFAKDDSLADLHGI
jgi:hypothetical protein